MAILVFTDGSGTHIESDPACIGVAIFDKGTLVYECGEYVGAGTNNVAELRAVRRALRVLLDRYGEHVCATVYCDSKYAIGCVTNASWDIQANEKLVQAIRDQYSELSNVEIVHIDGHAGIPGNEFADYLAWSARVAFFAKLGIVKKPKKRPELPTEEALLLVPVPKKPRTLRGRSAA